MSRNYPTRRSTVLFAAALSLTFATARADTIYVSNFGNATIEKFTSAGAPALFSNDSRSANVEGLALDISGNLYAASQNGGIYKFTPAGGFGTSFITSGTNSPFGLAFDASGNLYSANSGGA